MRGSGKQRRVRGFATDPTPQEGEKNEDVSRGIRRIQPYSATPTTGNTSSDQRSTSRTQPLVEASRASITKGSIAQSGSGDNSAVKSSSRSHPLSNPRSGRGSVVVRVPRRQSISLADDRGTPDPSGSFIMEQETNESALNTPPKQMMSSMMSFSDSKSQKPPKYPTEVNNEEKKKRSELPVIYPRRVKNRRIRPTRTSRDMGNPSSRSIDMKVGKEDKKEIKVKNHLRARKNPMLRTRRKHREVPQQSIGEFTIQEEDEIKHMQREMQNEPSITREATEAFRDGKAEYVRLDDIRSVHLEHPIPYLHRMKREHRSAYRKTLLLCTRLAGNVGPDGWSGIVILFGNTHKAMRCLRNRVHSRTASSIQKKGDSKRRSSRSNLNVRNRNRRTFRGNTDDKLPENPARRNLLKDFKRCEKLVKSKLRRGNVFVVSFSGTIEAYGRGAAPLENKTTSKVFPFAEDNATAKYAAISTCPCIVIRAESSSRGRLQVFYDGAYSPSMHDRVSMPPQGLTWFDPTLPASEDALVHEFGQEEDHKAWHPRMVELGMMERHALNKETLQLSLQCVVGEPSAGIDDIVHRYAARARTRYDAIIHIPGTSDLAAKNRMLQLGYYLRIWRDLSVLPTHEQRKILFYDEILEWYSRVLIVITSMCDTPTVLQTVAPTSGVPPECFVHIVVATIEEPPRDIVEHIPRIGTIRIKPLRPSQSMRIIKKLPVTKPTPLNDEGKDEKKMEMDAVAMASAKAHRKVLEDTLHNAIDGDALAMRIACSIVKAGHKRGGLTLKGYISNLLSSRSKLEKAMTGGGEVTALYSVVADAVRALSNKRTPSLLLTILAYVDSTGIHTGLLNILANNVDVRIRHRIADSLQLLQSLGLITRSPDMNSIHMHVAVARVIRDLVDDQPQLGISHSILPSLVQAMSSIFRYIPGDNRAYRRDRRAILHLISICYYAATSQTGVSKEAREASLVLLCRAIEFLSCILQQRVEANKIANAVVSIGDRELLLLPKGERIGVMIRLHCRVTLGRANLEMGKIQEAKQEFEAVINDLREANENAKQIQSEPESKEIAATRQALSALFSTSQSGPKPSRYQSVHNNSRDVDESEAILAGSKLSSPKMMSSPSNMDTPDMKGINSAPKEEKKRIPRTVSDENAFDGSVLSSRRGRAEFELPPMAEALWVMAHMNLARVYLLMERPIKAKEAVEEAYDAVEMGWGNSGDVAGSLERNWFQGQGRALVIADLREDLSSSLWRTGEIRAAKSILVKALCTRYVHGGGTGPLEEGLRKLRKPGERIPGIPWVRSSLGRTCNSLGVVLSKLGRYNSAHRAFEAAYSVLSYCHGMGSPEVATVLLNWATVLEEKGAFVGSLEGNITALMARRRIYGDLNPLVAEARNNLGIILWKLGYKSMPKAHEEFNASMYVKKETYGDDYKSTSVANTHVGIGNILASERQFDAGIEQFQMALENYEGSLGDKSLESSHVLYNMGVSKFEQAKYRDSQQAHRESLLIRKEILGENHKMTAASKRALDISTTLRGACVIC